MASTEGERRNKDLQPDKPMQNSSAKPFIIQPSTNRLIEFLPTRKQTAPKRGRTPPAHAHTPPPLTIAEKKDGMSQFT
jgi:hypothetical protein